MAKPRILGGRARGQALETPARGTRPSPARLREAIFDALQGRSAETFLDLFAGSGAVGLEAASRGYRATLVERDRSAAAVARRNARRLGLDAEIVQGDAVRTAAARPGAFDVVFVDPPFDQDLSGIFAAVIAAGPAAPGGRYLFQHPETLAVEAPVTDALRDAGVTPKRLETRRYGSNRVLVIDLP